MKDDPIDNKISAQRPSSNVNNLDPSIQTDDIITPSVSYAVYSPVKPVAPSHVGEIKSNAFNIEWKKSMFEAYSKNAKVGTFTAPFSVEDVPHGKKILNSKVAFKTKEMDSPNMWDLYSRHCANGSAQKPGIDFNSSYAAIVTTDSIRICLAFGASMQMLVFLIYVGNAFQTNLLPSDQRIYVRCPPYYLDWFKITYPKQPLPPAKTCYVLQAVHSIQGSRSAGNEWYELSSRIFCQMGMHKNATDNAVFVFCFGDYILFLLSNVDDFLILSTTKALFIQVK